MEVKICNNKSNFHNKKTGTIQKSVPYIKSSKFLKSKYRICPKCYLMLEEGEKQCPNCKF